MNPKVLIRELHKSVTSLVTLDCERWPAITISGNRRAGPRLLWSSTLWAGVSYPEDEHPILWWPIPTRNVVPYSQKQAPALGWGKAFKPFFVRALIISARIRERNATDVVLPAGLLVQAGLVRYRLRRCGCAVLSAAYAGRCEGLGTPPPG